MRLLYCHKAYDGRSKLGAELICQSSKPLLQLMGERIRVFVQW